MDPGVELWALCWPSVPTGEHESQGCGWAGLDKVTASINICLGVGWAELSCSTYEYVWQPDEMLDRLDYLQPEHCTCQNTRERGSGQARWGILEVFLTRLQFLLVCIWWAGLARLQHRSACMGGGGKDNTEQATVSTGMCIHWHVHRMMRVTY